MTKYAQRSTSAAAAACLALFACGAPDPEAKPGGMAMGGAPTAEPTAAGTATAEANQPPVISKVSFFPPNAQPGTTLQAQVEANDPDGDSIELRYSWRVGGRPVGGNSKSYRVQGAKKNEQIEVTVIAADAAGQSAPVTARTRLANQPPVILGAVLEPLGEVSAENDITVAPRSMDPDGDRVEYTTVWRVNGQKVGNSRMTLPARFYKRGDHISFTIVARDGSLESEPLVSDAIPVVNAAPTFTSTPSGLDASGSFAYSPMLEDRDGDRTFRYRLVEGPTGMKLESATGKLVWNPKEGQTGPHVVELEAIDRAGGSAIQKFTLTVGYEEASPPAAPR